MNYTDIKKLSLKVFVGFLGLTAVIAIISVLSGEFGELQWKILATTFTISAASICAMSCAAFIEKRKLLKLGLSGIFLSIIAAALVIFGIWPEIDSDQYWKTTASVGVFAVALAHAFLLVLPQLNDKQKWFQLVSAVSICILAALIVNAVWFEIEEEEYYRMLAVVAIIVALETLVTPILMKLQKPNPRQIEQLILKKIEDNIYMDSTGKKYELREM